MIEGQFSRNTQELVTAYLRHYENPIDDNFWAFAEMSDLTRKDSSEGWAAVLMLVKEAPSLGALMYIAAGPLEDILNYHGDKLVEIVSQEAEENKTLRYALAGVWLSDNDFFYDELRRLESKYKFDEIDPLTNQPWSEENQRPG